MSQLDDTMDKALDRAARQIARILYDRLGPEDAKAVATLVFRQFKSEQVVSGAIQTMRASIRH